MASLSVNGIVRITRDPEIRKVSTGSWLTFGIASYRKNVKEGKQSVDFYDAELYVKNGYDNDKHIRKGNLIYLENAYLRNDQYKNGEGLDRNKVKILIMAFDILKSDTISQVLPESIHPTDLPPPINEIKQEKAVKEPVVTKEIKQEKYIDTNTDLYDEAPPF